jgi:tRNA A-37 threonylcarbamoyl transferase component Bud32
VARVPDLTRIADRYDLLRALGRGGMATVYLARQLDLDRLVALKELAAFRTSDPSFAQRFLREAQLAASLSHPNIVTVHDYFTDRGIPYIAMEYLEHGSLRPYVGHMSLAQIGGVLHGVLAGLVRAEKDGIVHRDLKPENLLVTNEGAVKIADFGIAKATNALQTVPGLAATSTGMAIGTPNYMAPEQAVAQGVGPWTDLYAVGIMAFEFLTGRTPFGDTEQAVAVLLRQVNEQVPSLTELDGRFDPGLSDWVARMVSKEPSERPGSADAAANELEETLVAILGPRWRRDSRLDVDGWVDDGAGSPVLVPAARSERTTAPLAQPQPAATVAPHLPSPVPAPADRPPRRPNRRWWAGTGAKLLVTGVALAAVVGGVLARGGGGGGHSTAGSHALAQTTTRSSGVRPPAPTAAAPVAPSAPAPAVVAPTTTTTTSTTAAPPAGGGSLTREADNATKLANQYDTAAARVAKLKGAKVAGSSTARLRDALRQTADAYRSGAAAAAAGDAASYTAAMHEAAAGKQAVSVALADLRKDASGPATAEQSPSGADSGPRTACSGDSVSDDPSDEDCGDGA